nr:hypothetical protein CFP56_02481 [Quercus suber]
MWMRERPLRSVMWYVQGRRVSIDALNLLWKRETSNRPDSHPHALRDICLPCDYSAVIDRSLEVQVYAHLEGSVSALSSPLPPKRSMLRVSTRPNTTFTPKARLGLGKASPVNAAHNMCLLDHQTLHKVARRYRSWFRVLGTAAALWPANLTSFSTKSIDEVPAGGGLTTGLRLSCLPLAHPLLLAHYLPFELVRSLRTVCVQSVVAVKLVIEN